MDVSCGCTRAVPRRVLSRKILGSLPETSLLQVYCNVWKKQKDSFNYFVDILFYSKVHITINDDYFVYEYDRTSV